MSAINVTACAQAVTQKGINPNYAQGLFYWQFGMMMACYPPDFLDDFTTQQLAELLGGSPLKLNPRGNWINGQVNNVTPGLILPQQNFVAFAGQPNTPTPGALLVVNAGDLAQAATQSEYFMPIEQYRELALSYLIAGSVTSAAAQSAGKAALPGGPLSWPAPPTYWYTPPSGS